jgi:putative glutathione S-transferase
MTITADIETDLRSAPRLTPNKEVRTLISPEQIDDGGFRRQRNWFNARFGSGPGEFPAEPGRYFILGSLGCGWARRQQIVLRLLGLTEAVPFYLLTGRHEDGSWIIGEHDSSVRQLFGTDRLNDFYERSDPGFRGRGTSPTVIDSTTGLVVTNNYHVLTIDWETVWQPYHQQGAPDLYPKDLRQEIDLLNQQLFDDINNGTYKVIFARSEGAARVAHQVFYARLADLDFRLESRRYLFGDRLTDSDVRLFQTLSSFERAYRPAFAVKYGEAETPQVWDFPNLWGYARDLFAQGFADEREQYFLGLRPGPSGDYQEGRGFTPDGYELRPPEEALAAWQEPHDRARLTGSPNYSGPGGGGSYELWQFAPRSQANGS